MEIRLIFMQDLPGEQWHITHHRVFLKTRMHMLNAHLGLQYEIDVLIKKYKGLKKYAKSSLYAVKMMDGNENIITPMLEETEEQGNLGLD